MGQSLTVAGSHRSLAVATVYAGCWLPCLLRFNVTLITLHLQLSSHSSIPPSLSAQKCSPAASVRLSQSPALLPSSSRLAWRHSRRLTSGTQFTQMSGQAHVDLFCCQQAMHARADGHHGVCTDTYAVSSRSGTLRRSQRCVIICPDS